MARVKNVCEFCSCGAVEDGCDCIYEKEGDEEREEEREEDVDVGVEVYVNDVEMDMGCEQGVLIDENNASGKEGESRRDGFFGKSECRRSKVRTRMVSIVGLLTARDGEGQ